MDFKEDQLALEAYVRMRSNWCDEDEISHEEWLEYAFEYMAENPFPNMVVKSDREALVYSRLTGETIFWHRIPHTELYWEPGEFWCGMKYSVTARYRNFRYRPSHLRDLALYFGLIEDPDAEYADYEDEQV